jgi:hypothetical protein
MTTRLKIDLSVGSMEVDGEEGFVREVYQDFRDRLKAVPATPVKPSVGAAKLGPKEAGKSETTVEHFESLAECLAAARPKIDAERALVACAYYQSKNELDDFDAQSVNKQLKHTGQTVANITECMSANIDREPKLIIQLRKSGTTRQARKKYKVTDEEFAEVGRMIAAPIENA